MDDETYIERLARVEREAEAIKAARAEQALRVTAGYTTIELRAMPDSALRRWELDRAALLAACAAAHKTLLTFERLGLLKQAHEQEALDLVRTALARTHGGRQ